MAEETSFLKLLEQLTFAKKWPNFCAIELKTQSLGSCQMFLESLKTFIEETLGLLVEPEINICKSLFQEPAQGLWITNLYNDSDEDSHSKLDLKKTINNKNLHFVTIISKTFTSKQKELLSTNNFACTTLDQSYFYLKDWLKPIAIILKQQTLIEKEALILKHFGFIEFGSLDTMCSFINHLPFVSIQNLNTFKSLYKSAFANNSVFKFINTLFAKKKDSSKILSEWADIKQSFPIQYWTSFLLNKSWTFLQSNNSQQEQHALKQFFTNIYKTDMLSKEVSIEQHLEAAIITFISNWQQKWTCK